MTHRFAELMFTPEVQAIQEARGSRAAYARLAHANAGAKDRLGGAEIDFIAARDTLYMATVSENGWPYVQHRGGSTGFIKVLDDRTIGFADYRGNKQYVSVGNFVTDDRVALILMDYPNRQRLKILGHAMIADAGLGHDLSDRLRGAYPGDVERGIVVTIEAFDWNCPKYITQRFTLDELDEVTAPLEAEIAQLQHENARLRVVGDLVLL